MIFGVIFFSFGNADARVLTDCACPKTRSFDKDWSICRALYDHIFEVLPEGSTMIELGSGWASGEFSKHFIVWSIEHDEKWVGKYDTKYIYAPIVDGWYSLEALKGKLPSSYDLILVDGPPGVLGRGKFLDNLDLFNTDVTIVFDDVNRAAEYRLMEQVAQKLGRKFYVNSCGRKSFGVLPRAGAQE